MNRADRLFPELVPGASLRWYVYLFGDGSISRDPALAIAARRNVQFVRLIPQRVGAAFLLRRELEPVLPDSLLARKRVLL